MTLYLINLCSTNKGSKSFNVNDILQLQLPPKGVKAQSGVHGAKAMAPLLKWKQFDGWLDAGNHVIISIPLTLLLAGAHPSGAESAIINKHSGRCFSSKDPSRMPCCQHTMARRWWLSEEALSKAHSLLPSHTYCMRDGLSTCLLCYPL